MANQPLVSFIIPAYNASSTIIRCLDSIYNLNLDQYSYEYEVIIIDDCSEDNTVEIIQQYTKSHKNLTLLLQSENHRQGAARNRGLQISRGKYIQFLDSDDELDSGIITAIAQAEQQSLDIVTLKAKKVSLDQIVTNCFELPYNPGIVFSGRELQKNYPFWFPGPVLYLFLADFVSDINYPFAEDVLYEDSDFVSVHLFYANRIGCCDKNSYIIHENLSSTTNSFSFKSICDYALLGTRMLSFYNVISFKDSVFASSILEGGSFNIMKAFKSLLKLRSKQDICLFYDRFDTYANRESLLKYREPHYCWTKWTRFCLGHRKLATFIINLFIVTSALVINRDKAFR